jgi:hypothetical protein
MGLPNHGARRLPVQKISREQRARSQEKHTKAFHM